MDLRELRDDDQLEQYLETRLAASIRADIAVTVRKDKDEARKAMKSRIAREKLANFKL